VGNSLECEKRNEGQEKKPTQDKLSGAVRPSKILKKYNGKTRPCAIPGVQLGCNFSEKWTKQRDFEVGPDRHFQKDPGGTLATQNFGKRGRITGTHSTFGQKKEKNCKNTA